MGTGGVGRGESRWNVDWNRGRESAVGWESQPSGGTRKGILAGRLQFWLGVNWIHTLASSWEASWGNEGSSIG